MLALLPTPFRTLLFDTPENLNTLANEVFESLALLMPDSKNLLAARRALLMLGPKPQNSDFGPLEELHQSLSKIGPGFAGLLENALESGDLFVESPIQISAYSPALQERLKPLQTAADELVSLESGESLEAAHIVLSCMKALYPDADIHGWLEARGVVT
ncbi:MAG: hypothetical protein WCK49_08505 [Myxococcaceae bacterium]